MPNNVVAVAVGVLIATFSFMLKEALSYFWDGIRFRRRLVEDIKIRLQHYDDHYPELGRLKAGVSAPKPAASFIWDSSVEEDWSMTENFVHLRPLEAAHCAAFFDALSRIDEVRAEYNDAVRGLIINSEKLPQYASIAVSCLSDMEEEYADVIRVGSESLLELSENHWFLNIEQARCAELKKKYA